MAIFKCKMCGGDIQLSTDKTFGTCECCGTSMTFPKVSDEQRLAMFNRGNAFRRAGEFDKALALYENILREDDTDAEAHWCCALCRFGIEYVEDPATMEYIPTCHRASFDSFLDDMDYKAAVENAEGLTKRQYQKDALRISDVQKRILATSQNEEPFDIFICYKETDDSNGQRTKDSVDAQEIYYQLTNEGYRVFFSRITLEGKTGAEYEPYIFAALNSSKVMVVIGSKTEYFNAVWVKNEWSRFLAMMRKDRKKLLLPCYRDITPYDLPEQLSVLQSYDMSKIGFIQDLIRGIGKIVSRDEPKPESEVKLSVDSSAKVNSAPLLKRAFMFLEDGNWAEADEYCEKVLDQDPENAEAYLGKLMAELKAKTEADLKNTQEPFDKNGNAVKAGRFSSTIALRLREYNDSIRERNENTRKTVIYKNAVSKIKHVSNETEFKSIASMFLSIKDFEDAEEKAAECMEKAEIARKDGIYNTASEKLSVNAIASVEEAQKLFESIIDWKDSRTKIDECTNRIADIRIAEEKAEAERKRRAEEARIATEKAKARNKKIAMIGGPIIAVLIVSLTLLKTVILPASNYKKAVAALNAGNYSEAYSLFNKNPEYKNTDEQIKIIGKSLYGYKFKNIKAGSILKFGNYYQNNSNNKEEIDWRVLEVKNGKALIISEKSLDCQQYNTEFTSVTWETCSLRKWLNETFINNAFNNVEQTIIIETKVTADANPTYSTSPGNKTEDKVFILSITEAEKYFSDNDDRMCVPTAYAIEQGAFTSLNYTKDGKDTGWWWLRSPGYDSDVAAYVYSDGGIRYGGNYIDTTRNCIRPAMWIEID